MKIIAYSTIEKRVTSLEEVLATFITTTGNALARLEKEIREFKDEMKEFKDQIQQHTNKTDEVIAELNKKFGDMIRRMGTVVEDLVFPAVPRQLRRKCKVTLSSFGIRKTHN